MKDINILWFKKDLRIYDNEALYESLNGIKKLIQIDNGNFAKKVF